MTSRPELRAMVWAAAAFYAAGVIYLAWIEAFHTTLAWSVVAVTSFGWPAFLASHVTGWNWLVTWVPTSLFFPLHR